MVCPCSLITLEIRRLSLLEAHLMTSQSINWATVFNRRMFLCVLNGFASGLPLYILIQLLPAWLRTEGVSLQSIGLFALVQLPYAWKFLWAPAADRYVLPILGRRRGWLLVFQLLLLVGISAFGLADPNVSLQAIVVIAVCVAFFSASQDVVLDAYRRELLLDNELGLGSSIQVQAYRLSSLIPGSLAFVLADFLPWSTVFPIVAAFMLVGLGLTLFAPEPQTNPEVPRTLQSAVVDPFREFVGRKGLSYALFVISFMFLYKLGDNMAVALSTPFYIDLGFTLTEIGLIAKNAALWPSIIGGLLGGVVMLKIGINRSMWAFGFVQWATIFGFAILAEIGPSKVALAAVISAEYLGVGLGTAAFTAFMLREANVRFAATQLALFTAFASVPRSAASAASGYMVEMTGWTQFFLICGTMAIPGMLLLFKVAPWNAEVQEHETLVDHKTTDPKTN